MSGIASTKVSQAPEKVAATKFHNGVSSRNVIGCCFLLFYYNPKHLDIYGLKLSTPEYFPGKF